MRAARFHAAGDIRVEDIPLPVPQPGEVLVNVAWAGICGTDLHEYTLGPLMIPRPEHPHSLTGDTLPITLGHEFCGYVGKLPPGGARGVGGVELKEGMPIMADPRLNCSTCFSCHAGASNVCGQMGFLGLSGGGGGGFSEIVAVASKMLYPLPNDVKMEEAVLIEPLAVGRHALSVTGILDWGKLTVLVVGGGPVGLSVLLNLRARGAHRVFLSEPTPKRRTQTAEFADQSFNPAEVKVGQECRKLTEGEGVDLVFDCAGIPAGLIDGMDALRPKGTYVNVAGWESPFEIPLGLFMLKELTLKSSMAYDNQSFSETVEDFIAGKYKGAEKMITARIALEDVQEHGFEQLIKNRDMHIKILATPQRGLSS